MLEYLERNAKGNSCISSSNPCHWDMSINEMNCLDSCTLLISLHSLYLSIFKNLDSSCQVVCITKDQDNTNTGLVYRPNQMKIPYRKQKPTE